MPKKWLRTIKNIVSSVIELEIYKSLKQNKMFINLEYSTYWTNLDLSVKCVIFFILTDIEKQSGKSEEI